jgi:hypothetical protein
MKSRLLLWVTALVLVALASTPTPAPAKACIWQPNTPVFPGSGSNCSNAYGPAIAQAASYAASVCAAQCSDVCLYDFEGGDCTGTGPYYASGYGTYGCTTPPPTCGGE